MKRIKFYTVGCKVNQYDTQSIREQFLGCGFKETANAKPADIYLINTCTVTHKADRDSLYYIKRAHQDNPKAKIIVTGCLTELDSQKVSSCVGVNLIVKNRDKNRIINLLNEPRTTKHEPTLITHFQGHTRAFLKIQDGCNNFCSYCKVALVRGSSRSKPLNEVILEAEALVKNGFKEIVLCGICLGAYGRDLKPQISLVEVMERLEDILGLVRIRLSSIEPGDVTDALIQKLKASQKLCHHLHIPLQSGDDEILKRMHRNYTSHDYLNLIAKIKKHIPQIAITTDIMVGFPGEAEKNFKNTLQLVKNILPLRTHIFTYSLREGTAIAKSPIPKCDPKIINQRREHLKNLSEECGRSYKKQFLGKEMPVLIERLSKSNPGFWEGYTDNYIKIKVRLKSKDNLKNRFLKVRLKKITKDYILADFD